MSMFRRLIVLTLFVFFVLVESAIAQTSTATLIGTVRDSSGAILPSVTIM